MDNEIEIEEHNILENPALLAIFPDITALKQELDYDNEVYNNILKDDDEQDHNNAVNLCGINNPDFTSQVPIDEKSISQQKDFVPHERNIHKNEIYETRKRACDYDNKGVKYKKALVVLPDIAVSLKSSKTFCHYCLIKFPSINRYTFHTKVYHKGFHRNQSEIVKNVTLANHFSDLEPYDNKRTVKNVSKNLVSCFHCNNKFSNKKILIEHLYDVLESKLNKKNGKPNINTKKTHDPNVYMQAENVMINKSICYKSEEKSFTENKIEELYIQCHLCSYYFKDQKYFSQHMLNKHGSHDYTIQRVKFTSTCIFCAANFGDFKLYNKHLCNKHKVQIFKNINFQEEKVVEKTHSQRSINDTNRIKKLDPQLDKREKNLYLQCHICYYYYGNEKFFKGHMLHKHKITKPTIQPVEFVSSCKFCAHHSQNIKLYNAHTYNRHRRHISDKINKLNSHRNNISTPMRKNIICERKNVLISKSTLYKCSKCDIVFVSPIMALNHKEHMEILINWRCVECNLYFKSNDSVLHLKQHTSKNDFTILEISDELLSKLLYCCTKCTIHFQEDSFIRHYSTCENDTPPSVHCNICDILIDSSVKKSHQSIHRQGNMNISDFVLIDLIDEDSSTIQKEIVKNKKIKSLQSLKEARRKLFMEKYKMSSIKFQNYHLYHCKTCKCFVSKLHKVFIHRESRCSEIVKYPCKFCGLVFTNKGIMSHRILHHENKELKLQDFTFYTLDNGEKICPPIPDLPKCESCNIHLVYKNDIRIHVCGETSSRECPFCGIKLTLDAYKIHLPFHEYSNVVKVLSHSELKCTKKTITNSDKSMCVTYYCKVCSSIMNSYDKVIEHCQQHLESKDTIAVSETKNVPAKGYTFETFYYGSPNDIWLKHLFGSLSDELVNKYLSHSIYRYESRIRMEISQEGNPAFPIYKCARCNLVVDCLSAYKHIDNCKINPQKYECKICTLRFLMKESLDEHLKIHKQTLVTEKSFRIICFNKPEHQYLNGLIKRNVFRPYIIYECRNCNGLVYKEKYSSHECNSNDLKKCNICGLLLYGIDYDEHLSKHKLLKSFTGNNMKVILLGDKVCDTKKEYYDKRTFIGVVCDYYFYECSKCHICIRDFRCTSRHFCLHDSGKAKCIKCDLYFDEGKLKGHLKLHETDQDFVKDNILTIPFHPKTKKK